MAVGRAPRHRHRKHAEAIERHLIEESASATLEAERAGRLRFLDARTTLDRLLGDGQPDDLLFDQVVGEVRVFGEMVSLLWSEGRHAEAEGAGAALERHPRRE